MTRVLGANGCSIISELKDVNIDRTADLRDRPADLRQSIKKQTAICSIISDLKDLKQKQHC